MADANPSNTYRRYPRLVDPLLPLVRKQRRLAAKLAPLDPLTEQDKAVRKEIDALLVACGLGKGEGVTCAGYDVTHREREGNTAYDIVLLGTLLVEKLIELGLAREDAETFVVEAIATVRSKGDTSKWAEVKPMKGAKVRAA